MDNEKKRYLNFILPFILIGVIAISIYKLDFIEKKKQEDLLYLPRPEYIKMMCLDFEGFMADLYWIKGILYFGSHYQDHTFQYKWLYNLFDLASTLDSYYYDIYWSGSLVLTDYQQANNLLEKGRVYFPDNWKLPEMIGFNYHHYGRDLAKAAQYYAIAGKLPGHPPYVPSLSARFYNETGNIEEAIKVLKNFRDTTEDEKQREEFTKKIHQLEHTRILEKAVTLYRQRFSKYPPTLEELTANRILKSIPLEPFGGFYFWDEKSRRIWSSRDPIGMEKLRPTDRK
ncbi:MAG: hypothetical protein V1872_05225 [bacterium]